MYSKHLLHPSCVSFIACFYELGAGQFWIFIGRADAEAPHFGHLMWRTNSLEKILMLGKIEGRRRRGWQRMRWLDGVIDSMDINWRKLQEIVKDREACHAAVHGVAKIRTRLSDWTELNSHYGKQHGEVFKKLKMELPYDQAIPLLDIYPKEIKLTSGKVIRTSHVHCSFIRKSQGMKTM